MAEHSNPIILDTHESFKRSMAYIEEFGNEEEGRRRFFADVLYPFYDFHGRPIVRDWDYQEAGHLIYVLSELIPPQEHKKITIAISEDGSQFSERVGQPFVTVEDWRLFWQQNYPFISLALFDIQVQRLNSTPQLNVGPAD